MSIALHLLATISITFTRSLSCHSLPFGILHSPVNWSDLRARCNPLLHIGLALLILEMLCNDARESAVSNRDRAMGQPRCCAYTGGWIHVLLCSCCVLTPSLLPKLPLTARSTGSSSPD